MVQEQAAKYFTQKHVKGAFIKKCRWIPAGTIRTGGVIGVITDKDIFSFEIRVGFSSRDTSAYEMWKKSGIIRGDISRILEKYFSIQHFSIEFRAIEETFSFTNNKNYHAEDKIKEKKPQRKIGKIKNYNFRRYLL